MPIIRIAIEKNDAFTPAEQYVLYHSSNADLTWLITADSRDEIFVRLTFIRFVLMNKMHLPSARPVMENHESEALSKI